MLRLYLCLALRTMRCRKAFTVVNTVGLACCAFAVVFLQYELSHDSHHEALDRIYRILSDYRSSTYSTISFENYWSAPPAEQRSLATRLPEAIPAIEQATNFEILRTPIYVETADGSTFWSDRQLLTNTGLAFADLFTFEWLAGAPLTEVLHRPYAAVLTASAAETYFGNANPYWNRGYATAAARETLRFAFEELSLERVFARPLERNAPSRRVLEKLGFQFQQTETHEHPKWTDDDLAARYVLDCDDWGMAE